MAGNKLSAALVTRLALAHENCAGLKDSSGDLNVMFASNHLRDGRFNTAIGPDNLILAGLSLGLDATVSGGLNLTPEIITGIYRAFQAGDMARAREWQGLQHRAGAVLARGGWLAAAKGLMKARGLDVGMVRPPLQPAPDDLLRELLAELRALGVELSPV